MVRILLLDDHVAVAEGTKALIELYNNYYVTICHSPEELLSILKHEQFDVLLLDVNLPNDSNGNTILTKLKADFPGVKIVLHTGLDFNLYFCLNHLTEQKIDGFISKSTTAAQLKCTLDCVINGYTPIPTELFWKMRYQSLECDQNIKEHQLKDVDLTESEIQVIEAISNGLSNQEISDHLQICMQKVDIILASIFTKLEVKSRVEALVKVKMYNLIP